MEGILSIKNLSKSFERSGMKTDALKNASFELKCGEILGIVGTSGSGKSTLLRLISGLEALDAGSIRLDGHELGTKRSIAEKRDIQMIFQDAGASFHPRRTIASSINDAFQSLMGKGAVLDLDTLCLNVGLSSQLAQRYPGSLSGGQCQRFAIARAMAVEPEVLLCDEITSALDTVSQAQIAELLRSLCRRRRMAAVFVSHDLALVSGLCSHLLVMRQGRVVEEGPPDRLVSAPCHPYTRRLISSVLELQ